MDTHEQKTFPLLKYSESYTGNFFEKPPLWYWTTISVVKIFGSTNLTLRIVSAVSGFCLISLIFLIGHKLFSYQAGIFAALTFMGTHHLFYSYFPGYFSTHSLRSADLDALQLLLIMLSFFFFYISTKHKSYRKENKRYVSIILASIFTALAFLTKGPFALLPGLLYFSFQFISLIRKKEVLRFLFSDLLIYTTTLFLIAGSWHLWMYYQFGNQFIEEYFVYHIVTRSFSTIEGHKGYTLMFTNYLFNPKLFVSGTMLFFSFFIMIFKYKKQIWSNFKVYSIIIGTVIPLTIISLIKTQIAWYLFYTYPFACLLLGKFFSDIVEISFQWTIYIPFIVLTYFTISYSLFYTFILCILFFSFLHILSKLKIISIHNFIQLSMLTVILPQIYINLLHILYI